MAVDDPSQDPELPQDARLGSLEERLKHAQQQEELRNRRQRPDPNYRIGHLVIGHLIGAPLGGALVGWGIDSLAGTFPFLLVVMMLIGFGVGFRNVLRISKTPTATKN